MPDAASDNVLYADHGRRLAIIPEPVSVIEKEGVFQWQASTAFVYNRTHPELQQVVNQFAQKFTKATGAHLTQLGKAPFMGHVYLELVPNAAPPDTVTGRHTALPTTRGAYIMDISPMQIRISAAEPVGIFYALQSLWQLMPVHDAPGAASNAVVFALPCATIMDHPRFGWRGMHLDVSRHFFSVEEVKQYIDYLATYKCNVFHWHLTDDQGWRLEIKKYPKLTEVGARRPKSMVNHWRERKREYDDRGHEGFYTQEDVREVLDYAHARYITVIPEIEMPGHAQAAIAAYPEYGCADVPDVMIRWGISAYLFKPSASTFQFLYHVLDEVMALFPSRYIHIGGDEAIKQQWRRNPEVQTIKRRLGLKTEDELQSYFIKQLNQHLQRRGRLLMGWDEIMQGGLAPGAAVMSWRNVQHGRQAATQGHPVIMCPMKFCYFDFYQENKRTEPLCVGGLTPLKKVYGYEPAPASWGAAVNKNIWGLQGNVWTEYMPTFRRVQEQLFPRLLAIAEVGWSPRMKLNWTWFHARSLQEMQRLNARGIAHGPWPER